MDTFQMYEDIKARTNGEIYIGVVGPVRTGKSTFIKRFMDVLVLPYMEDEHAKARTRDELPQSGSGKTIMTTEPKFVPKEAAVIHLQEDLNLKLRLIDCVGYMVNGATGHLEENAQRMVKTPWFEEEIPFTHAAEVGTRKVIHEHATIGIVVTTDGTITEIDREAYLEAERKTIMELQNIGKPFVVLVNSKKPYAKEAQETAEWLEETYGVRALTVNCEKLKPEDITKIMETVLYEFPVSEIEFFVPKWVEMLPADHEIRKEVISYVRKIHDMYGRIQDVAGKVPEWDSSYIDRVHIRNIETDTGRIQIQIDIGESYYYEWMTSLTGTPIRGQYELIDAMRKLTKLKEEYEGIRDALASVRMRGYGMVSPRKEEIELDEPELIRQGNKFGVKIHTQAPSIHLIRANVETEIAPIVGNEQQAQDLLKYLKEQSEEKEGIWETNIFGKSVEELVMDGMRGKMAAINEKSQEKLQDTMKKIVNDSNGGMVCIII